MKLLVIILLLITQTSLAAEPIGRLFTSPAERSNLDSLRKTKKNVPLKIDAPVVEATPATITLPEAINMQGYVKRNDGKQSTVWVNNQAMIENTSTHDVMVGSVPTNGNRIAIKLPANGKQLTLKAGQVYNPETNKVREARNHGAQGESGKIADNDF
jgi:hypothetical protein